MVINRIIQILPTILLFLSLILTQAINFDVSDPIFSFKNDCSVYEIGLFKHPGAFSFIYNKSIGSNPTVDYELDALLGVTFIANP